MSVNKKKSVIRSQSVLVPDRKSATVKKTKTKRNFSFSFRKPVDESGGQKMKYNIWWFVQQFILYKTHTITQIGNIRLKKIQKNTDI